MRAACRQVPPGLPPQHLNMVTMAALPCVKLPYSACCMQLPGAQPPSGAWCMQLPCVELPSAAVCMQLPGAQLPSSACRMQRGRNRAEPGPAGRQLPVLVGDSGVDVHVLLALPDEEVRDQAQRVHAVQGARAPPHGPVLPTVQPVSAGGACERWWGLRWWGLRG